MIKTQSIQKWITARKAVWLLLIGGVIWFVVVSPKSPLEFFDAGVRDQLAMDALYVGPDGAVDAPPSNKRSLEWSMRITPVSQAMDRIELLHDLEHDPNRVDQEQEAILMGFYSASDETRESLRANHREYRALAERLEQLLAEWRAEHETMLAARVGAAEKEELTAEQARHDMRHFSMEEGRMRLRRIQAFIFWRWWP